MKILFAYRYGNLGGVTMQLLGRLGGFAAMNGVEIHFAFGRDHGLSRTLEHPHVLFGASPGDIARYCVESDIDIVSVIDTPEILNAVKDLPSRHVVLLEVHTTYPERLDYLRKLPERVHTIVVPSAYSASLVSSIVATTRVEIEVVRNCLTPDQFRVRETRGSARPVCLWVGKLDSHKNWRGFLDVAEALRLERSEIDLWMVGGATTSDDVKAELLFELYRRELSAGVRWLDWVRHEQMPDVFATVAASGGVMISTSRDESFGMGIGESLLCGCPVVASDVGAVREVYSDPEALRLYPFGDATAAKNALLATLEAVPTLADRHRWHEELAATTSPAAVCDHYMRLVEAAARRARAQGASS